MEEVFIYRTIYKYAVVFLIFCCFPVLFADSATAENQQPEMFSPGYQKLKETAEKGITTPLGYLHTYWKDGFRLDTRKKHFGMKLNLTVMGDGGYISSDEDMDNAFPDLEGFDLLFRKLTVTMTGHLYDFMEYKFQVDFSTVRDIQDQWVRFKGIPYIGDVTVGHVKEPFSLEELTSLNYLTFMENALPTLSFAPGRNMGITHQRTALNRRMTWAVGAFLNTGSFGNLGNEKDQLSEVNGCDLTGRVTGLPYYEDHGRRLLHFGLSCSYQPRSDAIGGSQSQFRARPESRLTNDRLVDTGKFNANWQGKINPELAVVFGPLSIQGETSIAHVNKDTGGNALFWGSYVFASYFLTGESRNYDTSKGVFSQLKPNRNFHFTEEGWGAWELALRFSYLDLNGSGINGGREHNITAGLNWYLAPETRFMFNWIRVRVKDRDTSPSVDNALAHIFQIRFQMHF